MHRHIRKIGATVCVLVPLLWSATATAFPSGPLYLGHHHRSELRLHGDFRHGGPPPGVFGTVASVGGDSSPGTCGTAGAASGTFTLTAFMGSNVWAVTTNASTLFYDPASPPGSFTDVCVGSVVGAIGTVKPATNSVDPATKVFLIPFKTPPPPPAPHGVFGTVGSVGGDASPGTCGTAGAGTGTFTVNAFPKSTVWGVTINASTTFVDPAVSPPSFADVCVGGLVAVAGNADTTTNSVDPATKVFVVPPPHVTPPPKTPPPKTPPPKTPPPKTPPPPPAPQGVFGVVGSVEGNDSPGTCGTAGDSSGVFSVDTWWKTTWTVTLNASTVFGGQFGRGTPTLDFGDVCVGDPVGVLGTVNTANDTVDPATKVFVGPAKFHPGPPAPHGSFGAGSPKLESWFPGPQGQQGSDDQGSPHQQGWSPDPVAAPTGNSGGGHGDPSGWSGGGGRSDAPGGSGIGGGHSGWSAGGNPR
jgi:hypothetical protein